MTLNPKPNLNQFFDRVMSATYNCMDHAREVWRELTGEDIADRLPKLQGRFSERRITLAGARTFEYMPKPISPCIVLMQRPKDTPHVGIFYNGRVLQLTAAGVENYPFKHASRAFKSTRCYR